MYHRRNFSVHQKQPLRKITAGQNAEINLSWGACSQGYIHYTTNSCTQDSVDIMAECVGRLLRARGPGSLMPVFSRVLGGCFVVSLGLIWLIIFSVDCTYAFGGRYDPSYCFMYEAYNNALILVFIVNLDMHRQIFMDKYILPVQFLRISRVKNS